jgi:hypothetical protein
MKQHEIEFYQTRIRTIRRDFEKRHGGWNSKKRTNSHRRAELTERLFQRQSGLCYYCGEPLSKDKANRAPSIGHIKSVKHCAIAAGSDREACETANSDINLALVHTNPCNSFIGCDDMECGIDH